MTFKLEKDIGGVFHCDTCPAHLECEGKIHFTECWVYAKQNHKWRSYRGPDGKWAHACKPCTQAYAEEQRR